MNVLFIVLDTTRRDRLSPYNSDIEFTQHIETISEDARIYEQAVAQAPWTLPSHASMFTGTYPWDHGATQKNLYLETDRSLLAERFSDAGYHTACYTSNTWISPYTGMTDGFDDVDNFFPVLPSNLLPDSVQRLWKKLNTITELPYNIPVLKQILDFGETIHNRISSGGDSRTESVIEKAIRFAETDEDFFLFINLMDAHLPYYPPEQYRDDHAPEIDPSEQCQTSHRHNTGEDEADFEALAKLYDAEVDYMDDQLGRLFQHLRDNDLLEETVIVITADHGENLGEDNMLGHQFSVGEPLVHVPLIIHVPGREAGRIDKQIELRELYDLVPGLAGLDDVPDVGTEYALGGYEYPLLDLNNVPEEKYDELAKALRFVRTPEKRLVREQDDETTDRMTDIRTNEEEDIDQAFKDHLDAIGTAEKGKMLDGKEEKVKQRLEELGYI